jgi:hypothetical protein
MAKVEPIYAESVFHFLREIASILHSSGRTQLAERLDFATKHYIFPLTSEFYGVAMIALRETVSAAPEALSSQQLNRARYLADAIKAQWFSA